MSTITTRRMFTTAAALACVGAYSTTTNAGDDRVLWRFDLVSPVSGIHIATDAQGTTYASDNQQLYAINPDGSLKWTHSGAAGGRPIDFLADSAIITARADAVLAINPDGSTRWQFTWNGASGSGGETLIVGPSVGPDGNIYAGTSVENGAGLGAFSLTPDGDLRWSDEGDPALDVINATNNTRIFFLEDRLIFPFTFDQASGALIYGYDFDGNQVNSLDGMCLVGQPRTHGADQLILSTTCGLVRVNPNSESIMWTTSLGAITLRPAIGASGTIYSGAWAGRLGAVNPNGDVLWESPNISALQMFTVNEDSGALPYTAFEFGQADTIGAVDIDTGDPLWSFQLRVVNGHNELARSREAGFSPDNAVAYITTIFSSNGAPGAVYAIQLGDGASVPGDLNGDGVVDGADLASLLSQWGSSGDADLNGDGVVNGADLAMLLANWT